MEHYMKGSVVDFLKYSSEIFHWNIFGRFRACCIDTYICKVPGRNLEYSNISLNHSNIH